MHITVISGTFHPEPGGPPTYLRKLLPALQARGHTITVVTYTNEPHSGRDSSFPYPVWRVTRRLPIPLRLAALAHWIWRFGRTADVLFISDYGLPVAIANLVLRKPSVIKNVSDFTWEFARRHHWLPGDPTIDEFQHQRRGSLPAPVRLLATLQTWYTRRATLVLAPSHYSASLPIGWGIPAAQTRVVYNAIDLKLYADLPNKTAARQQLGLADVPQVLAVQRLAPWKHTDQIIAAFATLRQKLPNAHLTIIGDGPDWAQVQQWAAPLGSAVRLTGALPNEQVRLYLRAADVYVQFSTYEGLPHTVLEAMAAATPAIASQVGGNVEVIQSEQNGLLVPAGDLGGLTQAMLRLLTEPTLAARLSANASSGLVKFSWDHLVTATEAVLQEAARR
jgi:glycosyltransferase involved in cell wall biosynthesis